VPCIQLYAPLRAGWYQFYILLPFDMLCAVQHTTCCIISYHIISYHIISYIMLSYHIISYHIVSRRILQLPLARFRDMARRGDCALYNGYIILYYIILYYMTPLTRIRDMAHRGDCALHQGSLPHTAYYIYIYICYHVIWLSSRCRRLGSGASRIAAI
jgi:hypothetical protein